MTVCTTRLARHAESTCSITVLAPQGNSSFGRPMRSLRPAAGMTANARIVAAAEFSEYRRTTLAGATA
jgi:hypothetical protein